MHAPPAVAKPCATCGDLTGRGYPSCPGCATAVDRPWESAWAELADPDPERIAGAPPGEYRWPCVDAALRRLRCTGCGGELAAGDADCLDCAVADATRWELEAPTPHERALRTAVATLRAPAWRRQSVVSTWRLLLPFVVAGAVPTGAELREVRTQVLAGRYEELAEGEEFPPTVPLLPWRRSTA